MAKEDDILPHDEPWTPSKDIKTDFDQAAWRANEPKIAQDLRTLYTDLNANLATMSLEELRTAQRRLEMELNRFETGFLIPSNPDLARFRNPQLAISYLRDEYLTPNQPDKVPRATDVMQLLAQRIKELENTDKDDRFQTTVTGDPDLQSLKNELASKDLSTDADTRIAAIRQALTEVKDRLNNYDQSLRSDISNLLSQAEQRLSELSRTKSEKGRSEDDLKKEEVAKFLEERGLPLRKEGELVETYLGRLFNDYMANIVHVTIWNRERDQSDNPHTDNYATNPMAGPRKEMSILNHPQSYRPLARVANLGALWDQFPSYFETEADRAAAKEFADRQKEIASEISIWHNRALIRRQNYDNVGPDGSFKAHELIFKNSPDPEIKPLLRSPEMTIQEQAQAKAYEFCMSVWSARSLTSYERNRLLPHMSDSTKKFLANEYDVVPPYSSTEGQRLKMITDMVAEAERIIQDIEGIPEAERGLEKNSRKQQAEVAYHQGELYRIASGIEAELDHQYKADGTVKVAAQEGEPKALNIGLYVESAGLNEARPDFNKVFGEYLVHGYPPWARAFQVGFDYDFPGSRDADGDLIKGADGKLMDISGFGDKRASIVEIMAIDGAPETIKWDTKSTDPDKTVFYAASQVINAIWPRASVTKSLDPKYQFFIDPEKIPLQPTQILDQPNEIEKLRIYFGYEGKFLQTMKRVIDKFTPGANNINDYESIGFDSDSVPLSGSRLQHIKTLYKDFRDYWLSAMTADVENYPFDVIRSMKYLFSREGRDATDGYVNEKIQKYIEGYKLPRGEEGPLMDTKRWVKDVLMKQITGYVTYDVLLRSVFYLLSPELKSAKIHHKLDTQHGIEDTYAELGFENFEELEVTTRAGTELINAAKLAYVINQALLLREALPEEADTLAKAGYRMFGDNPGGKIFTRLDLLELAKEFGLGEGYDYRLVERGQTKFVQLQRIKDHEVTIQYLLDRVMLLKQLFHKKH